jgi:hypothetical protein
LHTHLSPFHPLQQRLLLLVLLWVPTLQLGSVVSAQEGPKQTKEAYEKQWLGTEIVRQIYEDKTELSSCQESICLHCGWGGAVCMRIQNFHLDLAMRRARYRIAEMPRLGMYYITPVVSGYLGYTDSLLIPFHNDAAVEYVGLSQAEVQEAYKIMKEFNVRAEAIDRNNDWEMEAEALREAFRKRAAEFLGVDRVGKLQRVLLQMRVRDAGIGVALQSQMFSDSLGVTDEQRRKIQEIAQLERNQAEASFKRFRNRISEQILSIVSSDEIRSLCEEYEKAGEEFLPWDFFFGHLLVAAKIEIPPPQVDSEEYRLATTAYDSRFEDRVSPYGEIKFWTVPTRMRYEVGVDELGSAVIYPYSPPPMAKPPRNFGILFLDVVGKKIEISDQQVKQTTSELTSMFRSRMNTYSNGEISSDLQKKEVEQLYVDTEKRVEAIFLEHQLEALDEFARSLNVSIYGIIALLADSYMTKELGIEEKDADLLRKKARELAHEFKELVISSEERSSRKFLAVLNDKQREGFEDALGKLKRNEFAEPDRLLLRLQLASGKPNSDLDANKSE